MTWEEGVDDDNRGIGKIKNFSKCEHNITLTEKKSHEEKSLVTSIRKLCGEFYLYLCHGLPRRPENDR